MIKMIDVENMIKMIDDNDADEAKETSLDRLPQEKRGAYLLLISALLINPRVIISDHVVFRFYLITCNLIDSCNESFVDKGQLNNPFF